MYFFQSDMAILCLVHNANVLIQFIIHRFYELWVTLRCQGQNLTIMFKISCFSYDRTDTHYSPVA